VFTVAGSGEILKHALKATEVLQKPRTIDELFAAIEACCGPGRDE